MFTWRQSLEEMKENFRGIKLTDPVLKIFGRVFKKLIRQQVDVNEMQVGFMPERELQILFWSEEINA